MAGINGTITIENSQYRPCIVGDKKALFHTWENHSEIVPPSNLAGGHGGGVVSGILGIVEYEDGIVGKVYPENIRFVDNLIKEYAFDLSSLRHNFEVNINLTEDNS